MNKRIILSDRELRVIGLAFKHVIKDEKYNFENSIVGKLGKEEMEILLQRLGLGEKEKETAGEDTHPN